MSDGSAKMAASSLRFPVAIVGYSYRMPGGIKSDDDFWRLLSEREIVREPVADRYGVGVRPIGGFAGGSRFASPYEGLIRDEDEWLFDRSLFGISQHEMLRLEPQVRMLLSCAWETVEHVGWDMHALRNSPTGVFVGAQTPAAGNWRPLHGSDEHTVPGISLAMLANRISYQFNLTGSSMTYCTACSAGLSAMHSAVNALRCGDCEQALVGAVTYLGASRVSSGFCALGVISADGKCNSFDADANGYMRSEGAFVYAIKPLEAAERDGDAIHAVVESTAVNAAGSADGADGLAPGRMITAPTRHAQIDLMREARARAGLAPEDFDYIEAHATATVVGDRMEGNAIAEAYGGVERAVPLRVSSVKSNVGHMEAAAFHCSLLKTMLMMKRRTFAPISKNYLVPNPEIDFESCPMEVQTVCEPFPDHPVTVGINSFGFGGANGHCVVREYRPRTPRSWSVPLAPDSGYMVPLSARNTASLALSAGQLRDTLNESDIDMYTLAGNLGRRRTHFAARTSFAVRSRTELVEALDAFAEEPEPVATARDGSGRVAMVFSGQGTQWAGCGRGLYEADPVFRRAVDAIEEHWREHSDVSLRDACFSAPQEQLDEVQLAQPSIFMIQCALVELLKTWDVYPDCVVGHSSGEVAAAYACGALSLEEATRLVFHRATLQQHMAGSGRMLAVGLDRPGVEYMLDALSVPFRPDGEEPVQVEVACENAPASTVICGKESALRPVVVELERRRLPHTLLPGNIAFHSTVMDPIKEDVLAALSFLDDCEFDPDAPFVSSVTGALTERLDSQYWWSNVRRPVRFAAAVETIQRDHQPDLYLEIAPHSALQPVIAQCLEGEASAPTCIPTFMRDTDICLGFQEALGALFRAGVELNFAAHYPCPEPIAHLLPGHPKDEQKTTDDLQDDEFRLRRNQYSDGPLVGRRMNSEHVLFESRLSVRDLPWLAEHRVHHASIMPAAGYIELVLQAFKGVPVHIESLEILQPCPVPETPVRLQTALRQVATSPDEFTFSISSRSYESDSDGELHCRGRVRRLDDDSAPDIPGNLAEIDTSRFEPLIRRGQNEEFYERLDVILDGTFRYGPAFRTVQKVELDKLSDLMRYRAELEMDEELWASGQQEGFIMCPPLMDGGLQVLLLNLLFNSDLFGFPLSAEEVTFLRPPTSPRLTCYVTEPPEKWFDITDHGQFSVRQGERANGSISFYDTATGDLVAHIGRYNVFTSNPKWNDLPQSRHMISWQPKFVPDGAGLADRLPDGEIDPAALIAALSRSEADVFYARHLIEFAGGREPDQTVLAKCAGQLAEAEMQAEFWLVSDNEDSARANFEAFHQLDAALRFESLEPDIRPNLDEGLLRPAAAEAIFLHREAAAFRREDWDLIRSLAVPGGLVLVSHDEDDTVAPGTAWTTLRADRCTTLLQAPHSWADAADVPEIPGPRWVLGERDSCLAAWASMLAGADVHVIPDETFAPGEFHMLAEWPQAGSLRAVDFLCGVDPDDPTGERVVARFVSFMQALVANRMGGCDETCRVNVVTGNSAFDVENPRGGALWGAVRSMAIEIGEEAKLEFRLVDLGDPDDLETLLFLARRDVRDRELAVRGNRLWAARMVSIRERYSWVSTGDDPAYRLTIDNPGQISGLGMKTCELPALGPDDVEIDISAAALNFRDVMVTLGLLPELAYERSALGHEVGMEASGVVRRVGSGVRDRSPGEEVAFIGGGSIANLAVVDRRFVFPKPACLSREEAASVLSVYVTAYYSLIHLARLRKGQRVLIHSAMGGVGQAAVALAKHVGAEIYATAGSGSKREQLLALGVRAAFDSRSFDWRDGLMEATGGEGVDVVLNSLAGRHIELCLRALRPGGWHCEIGKVDIYANNDLSLRIFRKNLRFAAIDIDRLMIDDIDLSRELSKACLELLDEGAVPPLPVTVFPYREHEKALRLMTTGKHQGKLVLKGPGTAADRDFPVADARPLFDPDATYLVTGGLGGFGLRLLPYLVSSGVRHLSLMDRDPGRGRDADWVRRSSALAYMQEDVELDILPGDVAVDEDVRRCVAQLKRPLKGVFHLAGVLDDCLLDDLTPSSIARVFAPKGLGALHLHRATADCELEHFVLFSSIASALGNLGQTNYSAVNGFLDCLAAKRRRQGRPGMAYNLAAVADAGMAARSLPVIRMMRAAGMPPVSSDFAVANLDFALRALSDRNHLVTALFERPPWRPDSPDYMRAGRLLRNQDVFGVGAGDELTLETVMAQIAAKVAELCGTDEAEPDEPLSSFGLTSISVAELGTFIQAEFNQQVSALELMTTATCRSIAHGIVHGQDDVPEEGAETDATGSQETILVAERRTRREPSVFASANCDHFPQKVDFELAEIVVD